MYPPGASSASPGKPNETLYLVDEQHRMGGISGHSLRPGQAAQRKNARLTVYFISADPKMLALEPDLLLTFSGLHADIVFVLQGLRLKVRTDIPARMSAATSPHHLIFCAPRMRTR